MALVVPPEDVEGTGLPGVNHRERLGAPNPSKVMGTWIRAFVRYERMVVSVEQRYVPLDVHSKPRIKCRSRHALPAIEHSEYNAGTGGDLTEEWSVVLNWMRRDDGQAHARSAGVSRAALDSVKGQGC